MNRRKVPEDPLEWPVYFPPTDPVKKFFIGLRWLGPDLSFFEELRHLQAARTIVHMSSWPTNEERDIALRMGKHFQRSIGWKTEYFLPNDRFCVVAYGPWFQSMDGDDLFEDAVVGIRKELRADLPDDFWRQTYEWNLQEVVCEILKKKIETTH